MRIEQVRADGQTCARCGADKAEVKKSLVLCMSPWKNHTWAWTTGGGILCVAMSYVEKSAEATRRLRRGERQLHCGKCDRWVWPEECDHPDRQTIKEYDADSRAIKKYVARNYPSAEKRYRQEVKEARRHGLL